MLATTAVALIITTIFFVPWRAGPSGEIKWAPVYRQPMSYVRSYDDTYSRQGNSRLSYEDGEVALGILALEIVTIGAIGWGAFVVSSTRDDESDD